MLTGRMLRPLLCAAALSTALTSAAAHTWQPVSPAPLPPAVQWQFVWPAPVPAPAYTPMFTPPPTYGQPILDAAQIHERLQMAGYRDIQEIKLKKHGIYKVKARDAQGRRVKLRVSATTGEVLRSRERD